MEKLEETCVRLENQISDLKKQIADLKKSNTYFQEKLVFYESNGLAKLYYSLNRKMNEAAEMLNNNQLQNIEIDDKNNKAFERIVKILEASEKMATSVTSLGNLAKITGDEKKDVERKPFNDLLAEKRY